MKHEAGKGQALLIILCFPKFGLNDPALINQPFDLEDLIMEAVLESGCGVFDGNEFAEGGDLAYDTFTMYIYGLDADLIHSVISPVLTKLPLLPGSFVLKRYGVGDVLEVKIPLHLTYISNLI